MSPRHDPSDTVFTRFDPFVSELSEISVGDQSRSQSPGRAGSFFHDALSTRQPTDVDESIGYMMQSMFFDGVVKCMISWAETFGAIPSTKIAVVTRRASFRCTARSYRDAGVVALPSEASYSAWTAVHCGFECGANLGPASGSKCGDELDQYVAGNKFGCVEIEHAALRKTVVLVKDDLRGKTADRGGGRHDEDPWKPGHRLGSGEDKRWAAPGDLEVGPPEFRPPR